MLFDKCCTRAFITVNKVQREINSAGVEQERISENMQSGDRI